MPTPYTLPDGTPSWPSRFHAFEQLSAQVTRWFRHFSVYIGGENLVKDSLQKGAQCGFRLLQFNAVVASNIHALHLYKRLGFTQLGRIPQGFLMKDGHYEDIILFYIKLI